MIGSEWPFRGRGAESDRLNTVLDYKHFDSVRISGRRRIGKSTFISEVFSQRKAGPELIMIEMRDPESSTADDAFLDLSAAAEAAGFATQAGLDGWGGFVQFRKLLISLIGSGAAVVLDEFHHARKLGLADAVRSAIDHFKTNLRDTEPRGKLIVTGSHQQQMIDMLKDTQPLFKRFSETIPLPQWSLTTVLRMAADQGFLRFPERFLSMHAALGGMPGAWRDFAIKDAAGRDIEAWAQDREWRLAFIQGCSQALKNEPADRWDNAAFTELSSNNLSVFSFIADKKRGFTEAEIGGELRLSSCEVRDSLKALGVYLDLVEESVPFTGGTGRWRVCDNSALFQMRVLGKGAPAPVAISDRIPRLTVLEGQALERMAAAWLEETESVVWSERGAWIPDLADIDAAAERGMSGVAALILAGCKRNPEKHNPRRLERQFNDFMAGIGDSEMGQRLRSLPRRRLLISPHFTCEARARFADAGFECVDIRDMARSFGIDPGPEPDGREAVRPADAAHPPDREILHAREAVRLARDAAAELKRQQERLRQVEIQALADKAQAEAELADAGWLQIRRRRDLRDHIAKTAGEADSARRQIKGLKPADRPREEVADLAARMTETERRRSAAEEEVRAMERNGLFLRRRRDPAGSVQGRDVPERSLIVVVADPAHCPPADSVARQWHHFAVWKPGPDAAPLTALRDAFPDAILAPAAEAAVLWPALAPEVDFKQVGRSLRKWGVIAYIDGIEGRIPDGEETFAEPVRAPEHNGPDLEM